MIDNKILCPVASIIKLFIILILISTSSKADENNIKYYSEDKGILSLMYHRFDEIRYPSTNIRMDIFKKQIEIINKEKYKFYDPNNLNLNFSLPKKEKKVLITIDDGFLSFYHKAWPFLKKKKIPFILFVSTNVVGKPGYMNWDQIREIENESFSFIGNHSHSHDYLINYEQDKFIQDINSSIVIFKKELGYNPIFFSYPFGEYSKEIKDFISKKFKFAFGQHSGLIDINKDKFELPRFPINEKYGDLKRFKFLLNLNTFQFKDILPQDKYILIDNNPPQLIIKFFEKQKNINNTNCFSNEGDNWGKSKTTVKNNLLEIEFREKYTFRRGRINCSLNDNGIWRWLGIQFSFQKS